MVEAIAKKFTSAAGTSIGSEANHSNQLACKMTLTIGVKIGDQLGFARTAERKKYVTAAPTDAPSAKGVKGRQWRHFPFAPVVAKKPAAAAPAKKPVVPKPAPAKKPVAKPVTCKTCKGKGEEPRIDSSFAMYTCTYDETLLGPILLQRFSETSDLARFAEAGARGCTALTLTLLLLMLRELIIDLDQWLTRPTSESVRPIHPHPTTPETPLDMLTPPTFVGKLFCLPCLAFFVAHQWLVTDAVLFVRIDAVQS
ncbi:hypothetical protein DFH06DRAFT_1367245 [Mycena polygramma]|nr:hypothetical protein DFH06DRAFT_1367245 [Mycena polygramma]